ncbi:unnamed protein product [Vitrella brassicaformis CCMP3155]|uniref:D-3-phosphoglycerate dehydrogenase n=2 Tax=Vitrella brassicaformis TaxID=1169539 RepID=A0A0G4EHX3_VITBC|nr:unnamed protein product [Vitrella brassicaformis CCMP3155]|mmetsp:Transcript_49137/g.123166  ORF Transcript_49137/g.123166 Transcript_49137/m.123166 type:complete len:544 (+) Transcript_49137:220-1851(+)|eukprot:CEL95534.1 unnamed protein product [Vitrella brassicaformis CCMP3155]
MVQMKRYDSFKSRRFRVLVSDSIDNAGIDILSTVADVDVKTKLTEDQICEIIPEYDAMMVRSGTKVTEKIIRSSKKLKIIGRAGVGVDNVNVKAATDTGIFVVNSPLGNTVAAAEHTLALLMALSRNIAPADASMRALKWERNKFMGSQLQGKILGIVGLGQVGSHVAKVAREMGMKLLTFDPYVNEAKAASLDCQIVTLEELYKMSDYITLHVPLIPETKHMINADTIKTMKRTCRIINASRGGVIDEKALVEALKEGRLAGAAMDVFEEEKAFAEDNPLLTAPNMLLTPHLGASTHEAQVNVAVDVAQQIKDTLQGNLPQSAVNIPGMRAAELQQILPLLSCCDDLGKVTVQLLQGALEKITVTLEGEYASERGDPMLLAVAKGALAVQLDRPVNFVNVKQVADTFKVALSVAKEPHHTKPGLRVEMKSRTETATVRGTNTDDGKVLMTAFQDVPIYMLLPDLGSKKTSFIYSMHSDSPGVLAKVTGILGKHQLNIGNLHLGRKAPNLGIAIASVDGGVSQEALDEVKALDTVKECKVFVV